MRSLSSTARQSVLASSFLMPARAARQHPKNWLGQTRLLWVVAWVLVGIAGAFASEIPPLPEGAFSIVALPDTQAYAAKSPETFAAIMQWILDNREAQRIAFVTHVGDIVDKNSDPKQWDVARRCMMMLHGVVPFGFSVGNHDMVTATGNSENFQTNFPASLFEHFGWYGGSYKNNANSWQSFEAEGIPFIIVHLECNAPDDALRWAEQALAENAGRRAIVTTHMYLGPLDKPEKPEDFHNAPKGRMRWKKCHGQNGNTPQEMWDKLLSRVPNLFMVVCGDQSRTQTMYQRAEGAHGNPVHELLSDYREGYIRVYRFMPKDNRVQVFTYSPTLGALCEGAPIAPEREQHQFSFTFNAKRE